LIALAKLDASELLRRVFTEVLIPLAVYEEVVTVGGTADHSDASVIHGLVERGDIGVVEVAADEIPEALKDPRLGEGETQAMALALRERSDWLLIDDARARITATAQRIPVKGTLGILVQAARSAALSPHEAVALVQNAQAITDIWMDAKVCDVVLAEVRRMDT
jgi:predicted nucleic acid-binding protein